MKNIHQNDLIRRDFWAQSHLKMLEWYCWNSSANQVFRSLPALVRAHQTNLKEAIHSELFSEYVTSERS